MRGTQTSSIHEDAARQAKAQAMAAVLYGIAARTGTSLTDMALVAADFDSAHWAACADAAGVHPPGSAATKALVCAILAGWDHDAHVLAVDPFAGFPT